MICFKVIHPNILIGSAPQEIKDSWRFVDLPLFLDVTMFDPQLLPSENNGSYTITIALALALLELVDEQAAQWFYKQQTILREDGLTHTLLTNDLFYFNKASCTITTNFPNLGQTVHDTRIEDFLNPLLQEDLFAKPIIYQFESMQSWIVYDSMELWVKKLFYFQQWNTFLESPVNKASLLLLREIFVTRFRSFIHQHIRDEVLQAVELLNQRFFAKLKDFVAAVYPEVLSTEIIQPISCIADELTRREDFRKLPFEQQLKIAGAPAGYFL